MSRISAIWLLSIWGGIWGPLLPQALAQGPTARLDFLSDSMLLGQVCDLRLEIRHPRDMVILADQEAEAFFPFELIDVQPEGTITRQETSIDRAVYRVRSFDISPRQGIKLRYVGISGGDTTEYWVESDSIGFISLLDPGQSQEFKWEKDILDLKAPLNYGLIFLIVALALSAIYVLVRAARKPWQRYQQVRTLRQEWARTQKALKRLKKDHPEQIAFLKALNHLWKAYLDPEDQWHLVSLTTTELKTQLSHYPLLSDQQAAQLVQTASLADQVVFAGRPTNWKQLNQLGMAVESILAEVYQQRKALLRSGNILSVPLPDQDLPSRRKNMPS